MKVRHLEVIFVSTDTVPGDEEARDEANNEGANTDADDGHGKLFSTEPALSSLQKDGWKKVKIWLSLLLEGIFWLVLSLSLGPIKIFRFLQNHHGRLLVSTQVMSPSRDIL